MKILIVEDEPEMLLLLRQSLEKDLYTVEIAATAAAALDKIGIYDYDCILLDINLPDGSGLDVLEALKRAGKSEGVLVISARNSVDDKVKGLDLGADDYLEKPFHIPELNARIKSILRRKKFEGQSLISIGNLSVNPEERTVYSNGTELALNRKEFDILVYFIANRNRLINKTALIEHVWGDHADETDSYEFIYSQIKNLRKKMKDQEAGIEIQAVYGVGYKLLEL